MLRRSCPWREIDGMEGALQGLPAVIEWHQESEEDEACYAACGSG